MYTLGYLFVFLLLQPAPLTIISPEFADGGSVPARFTCAGEDVNPTLIVNGIPEGTKSLVLVVDDPSAAPSAATHRIMWNIPPTETILENSIAGIQGTNVRIGHAGMPCPSRGSQRYAFKVFALDTMLTLDSKADEGDVHRALEGHVLATGQLVGEYSNPVASGTKKKKR